MIFFFIENFYIILLFVEINTLIGRPLEPEHLIIVDCYNHYDKDLQQ